MFELVLTKDNALQACKNTVLIQLSSFWYDRDDVNDDDDDGDDDDDDASMRVVPPSERD